MATFINTVSLRHVSAFKGPFSQITIDAFQQQVQQKVLPDIKLSAAN